MQKSSNRDFSQETLKIFFPDISSWFAEMDLEKYGPAIAEAEINYETLPDLAEEDLKELGLPQYLFACKLFRNTRVNTDAVNLTRAC